MSSTQRPTATGIEFVGRAAAPVRPSVEEQRRRSLAPRWRFTTGA
ncbi:MAG: hypothetical protein ACKOCN_09550 [Planctomycetaceae bacterium]